MQLRVEPRAMWRYARRMLISSYAEAMSTVVQEVIEQIASALREESPFGEVIVRQVTVLAGTGPDDLAYLRFLVSVEDPDGERGTWDREDVFQLRSRVSELAAESDVELPRIVVQVRPRHLDDDEGSSEEQDSALADRLDEA